MLDPARLQAMLGAALCLRADSGRAEEGKAKGPGRRSEDPRVRRWTRLWVPHQQRVWSSQLTVDGEAGAGQSSEEIARALALYWEPQFQPRETQRLQPPWRECVRHGWRPTGRCRPRKVWRRLSGAGRGPRPAQTASPTRDVLGVAELAAMCWRA